MKQPTNGSEPTPADNGAEESSANYMEAPHLFDPSDRQAQRPAPPVWNAVYYRAESENGQQQLRADAAGWTHASN